MRCAAVCDLYVDFIDECVPRLSMQGVSNETQAMELEAYVKVCVLRLPFS